MSHHPLEDAADEIYKLKQSRKGYFGNLTKLINRTSLLLTIPGNHDEVSYLIEKIEFALFKINKITNEYCQLVGDTEKANAKLIANEKEEHVNAILLECKTYLETVDVVSQVKSNLSGIQRLFKEDAPPHKDKESLRKQNNADRLSIKSRDTLSSRHSLPNNSLEAKLRAEQTRATAQRKLALSRKRQELTEAEIMLEVEEANGEFKIAKMLEVLDLENKNDIQNLQKMSSEKLSFNPRNTFKKADLTVPQTNINGRQSTSYLNARAQTFTPKRPDTQKLISTPTYNRKVIRNHTPFKASVHTDKNSNETNINEENGVDDFIDYLVEGQETVLEIDNDVNPTTLLQWEFESRHLPPIDLIKFNGDPTKWPEFIQSFKTRVHMKRSFSDSTRMERLISVLEGEAKQCVSSVGTDGIFYAGALKSLKTQFGNPYVVSYFKLKNLFDLPPLLHNDHQGLRCYYQQLKGTLTWLQSMGYDAVLRSIDNVTKAIMRLPKQLRSKFYIDMKETCYDETTINLLVFEKWLGKKINETFNPLASIIENEVKIKYPKYANGRQNMFALSSSSKDESNRVLKCWLCSKDHKVSDCDFLKNSPVT